MSGSARPAVKLTVLTRTERGVTDSARPASPGFILPKGTPGGAVFIDSLAPLRAGFRWLVVRRPRLPRSLLDVAANQPPQHLRRARIFFGAESLEQRLLARIDEDRESGGALLERQRDATWMRRGCYLYANCICVR